MRSLHTTLAIGGTVLVTLTSAHAQSHYGARSPLQSSRQYQQLQQDQARRAQQSYYAPTTPTQRQGQTLPYGTRQSAVVPSVIGIPSGPSYPAQQDWRGAYYAAPAPVKPSAPGSAMTSGGVINNSYPYGVVKQEYRVGPQQNVVTAAGTYGYRCVNHPSSMRCAVQVVP